MTESQIPMTFNANKHKYEIMLRKFWGTEIFPHS